MTKRQFFWKNCDILLFVLGILPLSVMLFMKCRYGFANIDESFYLTIPYRLCQGDALFLNEWHLSQMTGWILQLPMALFLRLGGSTEGVILAFRQLYVALHLVSSTVIFLLLRRKCKIGGAVAALFFCIYVPYNISTLCYNSMGLGLMTLSTVIVTCAGRRWSDVIGGSLYALAVLCCPYLAVLLPIYGGAVLLVRFRPKWGEGLPFLLPRRFGMYVLGIALPAALFLITVLPRIRPAYWPQIIAGLFSDPEHKASIGEKLVQYICGIFANRPMRFFCLILLCGLLVKQKEIQAILGGVVLALVGYILLRSIHVNILMFPLNLAGLYFYLVYRSASARPLFFGIWIPGMIYSVCIHLTSNQGFYVISSASTVSLMASVLIVLLTLKEELPKLRWPILKYGLVAAVVLVFLVQGAMQIKFRWNYIFYDKGVTAQTQLLTEGSHKGLLVTPEWEEIYRTDWETASHLNTESSLLVFGEKSYFYLFTSCTNSSYSGWPAGTPDSILQRLEIYYALCPDKRPDQILIPEANRDYAPIFLEEKGYVLSYESPCGDMILTKGN